jgi:hypothetical protein
MLDAHVVKYVEPLARRFGAVLQSWLTSAERREILARNARGAPRVCHSHDFCDANMAMDQAFRDVFGRPFNHHSDEDIAIFNVAWDRAKAAGFYFPER